MSTFKAEVVKVEILPHPNPEANFIELAKIRDYISVVKKGQFKTGDLAVYLQEGSILSEDLLKDLGFWDYEKNIGKLSGSHGNRVKICKLKNQISQGILYPLECNSHTSENIWILEANGHKKIVNEGDDVKELLNVTKYVPAIPASFQGELWNAHGLTHAYDLENIKNYPEIIEDNEEVEISCKIHGTNCTFAYHPDSRSLLIYSKGLGKQGLAFKLNDANKNNLYVKTILNMTHEYQCSDGASHNSYPVINFFSVLKGVTRNWYKDELIQLLGKEFDGSLPVYVKGEIAGTGVQDMTYGLQFPEFFMFDVFVGLAQTGRYLDADEKQKFAEFFGFKTVPRLYRGPFSKKILQQYTNGKECVSGQKLHIREGVVVKPLKESYNTEIGRRVLKSVSSEYLLRKNKNATEFE